MPDSNSIATQVSVKVDGSYIPEALSAALTLVEVDQSAFYPSMFTIAYYVEHTPGEGFVIDPTFDLTKEVEILFESEDGSGVSIIKGEIVSVEPQFKQGMIMEMVVRGYDKSHRLYRESRSEVYLNIKDSDLATKFAQKAGLSPEVDSTNTVYDAIYQDNQPDLAFLQQRAWRIGFECFVDNGKLYFKKAQYSGSAPKLQYGSNLLEFHPRLSLAEQVDEVKVKGWDWVAQKAVLGTASSGELSADISQNNSSASNFGTGTKILVDHPVKDQAEANLIAQARLNEISGAFATATGIALGNPAIKAGALVEIEELSDKFNGKYRVTKALHSYSVGRFITEFSVLGTRTGLLYDQMTQQDHQQRWNGVVPAIVTNTDDPEDYGRVKLQFPWMEEKAETWWARVVSPGAGKDRGFNLIPEVEDEVIVAFEHGDINRPFVLGGVWNGKSGIPGSVKSGSSGERPSIRSWTSSKGHEIAMYDTADDKIEIKTAGGHILILDDKNKKVELKTTGGHTISFDDMGNKVLIEDKTGNSTTMEASGVTIESKSTLTIKSAASMKLESKMIDINGSATVNIKGGIVNIN